MGGLNRRVNISPENTVSKSISKTPAVSQESVPDPQSARGKLFTCVGKFLHAIGGIDSWKNWSRDFSLTCSWRRIYHFYYFFARDSLPTALHIPLYVARRGHGLVQVY